jgi:hypothetical protein
MDNTTIDIDLNDDIRAVVAEDGGAVGRDVRVVIRGGVTKSEAHKALQAISSAINDGQIILV